MRSPKIGDVTWTRRILSIVIKYLQLDMAIFLFLLSKFMFERLIDVNSENVWGFAD